MTDKEIDRIIKANIQMAGFISLVRRMREAQIEKDESDQGYRAIPHICILEKKDRLESEVDEYLKKMEEYYGRFDESTR